MLFWVLKTYPEVCDGNQLINPELRNTLLHLLLKNIFTFRHRPSEFPGDFLQCSVVND